MQIRVVMLGPFPRSSTKIDGGVAAATTYLCQSLIRDPEIALLAARVAGGMPGKTHTAELGWPVYDLDFSRLSVSTFFYRQRRQLDALLRLHKPDLVHAQGADAAGFLAVNCGYPSIVTIHGILGECAKLQTDAVRRLREKAQAWITERHVVERAAHVIAISPYVTGYYRDKLQAVLHDIPNAISATYFDVRRTPEPGRFLFAGRISKGKGLLDLVQAVARSRSAVSQVVLAGAAVDKAFLLQLRSAIDESGHSDKFTFAGLLDEKSLIAEFSRATALVLPSYQETAPMVIQQAMAAGLPVMATRVGGIPYMVDHGVSGLLCDAGNVESLAASLQSLAYDGRLCSDLAEAGRTKAVESFSADGVARATRKAYEAVLATSR